MAASKFYVVWEGRTPGVYATWEACKAQIDAFPQAKYKSFSSREEAESAFKSNYWKYVTSSSTKSKEKKTTPTAYLKQSLAVDAACSGNPGDMEYQGVWVEDGTQIFHVGPLKEGTNNIGEFLALVHALALLKKQGKDNTVIYTDSKTAMSWIRAKKSNTKLEQTAANKPIFDLINRAEQWLAMNTFGNPIIKWETDVWGEIPADFGRK